MNTSTTWHVSTPGRTDVLYVGPVAVSSHRTALGASASTPSALKHIDDAELYAAARLMAAAPELLEALALLVAGTENSVSDTFIPLVKARAAIAKATS